MINFSKKNLDTYFIPQKNKIGLTDSSTIFKKIFYHQGIRYPFMWARSNHQIYKKKENQCSEALWKYLHNISISNYDIKLFNNRSIKRISQFRLNYLKRGMVPKIGKKLINEGVIQEKKKGNKTVSITKQIYENFEKNIPEMKVGHNEILSVILKKDKESIATEIPIWSRVTPEPITGHIDLVRIHNNKICVSDFKPEGNFMRSIPQVAYYGLLLKQNFKRFFGINIDILCSSFNKNSIWFYEPEHILIRIKEILSELKIKKFDWEAFV